MAEPDVAQPQGMERTLTREYYLSPELFAREKDRIFMREWFYAGREEDLRDGGELSRRRCRRRERAGRAHARGNAARLL